MTPRWSQRPIAAAILLGLLTTPAVNAAAHDSHANEREPRRNSHVTVVEPRSRSASPPVRRVAGARAIADPSEAATRSGVSDPEAPAARKVTPPADRDRAARAAARDLFVSDAPRTASRDAVIVIDPRERTSRQAAPGADRALPQAEPREIAEALRNDIDLDALRENHPLLSNLFAQPLLTDIASDSVTIYRGFLNSPQLADQWRDLFRTQQREIRREHNLRQSRADFERRKQQLLSAHQRALRAGRDALAASDYRRAAMQLQLATRLNEADPIARIHLAQARVALGHDDAAAPEVVRALQLAPQLSYQDLNLARFHTSRSEFDAQISALRERINARLEAKQPVSGEEYLLLGYFELQRDNIDIAHKAFTRAAKLLPRNRQLPDLRDLTRPATR